ncbi:MAG: 3'-5' exonuclease, partial [Clostridiales bacterium]
DDLEIFDTAYNKNGFIKLLLHTITEFKMYDIGLDDLQIMEEKWQSANKEQPLSKKLADISLVYEAMNQFCLNKYTDPIDGLQFLASSIEDGNFLQDSLIFIDGFIGFTPQEEAVLAAMMKKSAQIEITLTLDAENMAEELGPEDVFYPIWQTYQRFLALAAENRIGNCLIEKPLLLFGQQGRFSGNKELAFLEKELFPLTGRKKYPQKLNNIFLWTALNKRAEIEMVGKEILRLIREDGWDYRDISIISRNSALYENDLQMIFKDLQIPYFLDIKKPLLYHPLIELLRGVLDLLVEKNHYPYLFRYLKNPLSPLTLEETDILENYCLAAGIRHYHWQKDKEWTFWPFSLGDKFDETAKEDNLLYINQLKVKACREIWDLKEKLAFSSGIIQFSQALQEFLSALEIEEKLLAWSKEDLLHGAGEEAAVNRQVYDDILALLAEAEAFLADSALELEQIVSILDAGLANMSLKLIPPGLDQVFVASLDRSRNPQVKIAFVIGVNAGELPGKISGEGIFNNQERDILREEGWQLAPDSNKKQLAENFLVYTALTRCEEKLYISYKLS